MLESSNPICLSAIDLEYNPLLGGPYFMGEDEEEEDIRPY